MSLFDGRWRTEDFRPKGNWSLLEELWTQLRREMDDQAMAKYKVLLRRVLLGLMGHNQFDDETKDLLSSEAKQTSDCLRKHFKATCQMIEFEDWDYDVEGVSNTKNADLPNASNLNAVLMLTCLDKGLDFPDGDCAIEFNKALRTSVQNIMEGAVCTIKTAKLAEHGFLRYFWDPSQQAQAPPKQAAKNLKKRKAALSVTKKEPVTTIKPRDFFDSILLSDTLGSTDELFRRLEKSESLTNFYYKAMQLSYPHLDQNGV